MTLSELRYYFEHQLMPKYFFEDTIPFLTELIGDGEDQTHDIGCAVYNIFEDVARKAEVIVPYSPEDFQGNLWTLNGNEYVLRIEMPEAQESPQCKAIYLLFTTDFSHLRYFTVELLEIKWKRKRYVLCEWTQDGHSNYGPVPNDFGKIETIIAEKFHHS